MTRQAIWRYVKTGLFWLTYAVVAGMSAVMLGYAVLEQYYIGADYAYWRVQFTPFPPFAEPYVPTIEEYFHVGLTLVVFLFPCVYNVYLIWQKGNLCRGLIVMLCVLGAYILYGALRCKYWSWCG